MNVTTRNTRATGKQHVLTIKDHLLANVMMVGQEMEQSAKVELILSRLIYLLMKAIVNICIQFLNAQIIDIIQYCRNHL